MRMSTTTEIIAHHWAFAVFLIGAVGLCGLMLLGAYFLGESPGSCQNVPYESGIDSVGSARMRLSAKFYLVAMFSLFSMLKPSTFMPGQSPFVRVAG